MIVYSINVSQKENDEKKKKKLNIHNIYKKKKKPIRHKIIYII